MDAETRRATPADAEQVLRVFRESRVAARGLIPRSRHSLGEDAWFVNELLIRQRETWVAVVANNEVGAMMTLHGDWLDQLYVHPGIQRAGLGEKLLAVAKSERPGGLQLWTFRSNVPAQAFYEKHGFVAVEETDGSRNEDREPDIRYEWNRGAARQAVVTLSSAERIAGDLLHHDSDLVWNREWVETPDSWFITVNSVTFYMTKLDRHRLVPPRFVAVPKDGSAPRIVEAVTGAAVGSFSVGDEPFPRVSDTVLFASQPLEVWRRWLPQLRYFELQVVPPRYEGGDQLVARFAFDGEEDAAARLAALGLPTRQGERGLEFVPGGTGIAGVPAHYSLGGRSSWVPGQPHIAFTVSVWGQQDLYFVRDVDFENALKLERRFDELGWAELLDDQEPDRNVVTRLRYPELFE